MDATREMRGLLDTALDMLAAIERQLPDSLLKRTLRAEIAAMRSAAAAIQARASKLGAEGEKRT